MADENKFRLPRSSYEEVAKIVRAYGHAGADASLDGVAQLCGMNRNSVSNNNALLLSAEILEGGRNKSITQKGAFLAWALDHEMPPEVAAGWKRIVEENEFLSKMVQAIRIRRGMEATHLESHIAFSAGEKKDKNIMAGARAVVDILKASGLVIQEGDKILPNVSKKQTNLVYGKGQAASRWG